MSVAFKDRLLALQKDPEYFNPQKVEKLEIIFERLSHELGFTDTEKDLRARDRLAITILLRCKLYPDDEALVAAVRAVHSPSPRE